MESQYLKNKVEGGIDVHIQSQTSQLFRYILMQEIKTDITLTSAASVDDTVINVSAGHGFVGPVTAPGEYIVLRSGDFFAQVKTKSVTDNAVTIVVPLDTAFTVDAEVIRGSSYMNVDGSSAPVSFVCSLGDSGGVVPVDVQKVLITMQSGATVPDDGTFGGIPAIANGVYFRKNNTAPVNLGNYTSNQAFREIGGNIDYTQKAPAGTYATNIIIDIQEAFGQVIRLNPRTGDTIGAIVRDDIDALAFFTISLLGSYTEGE